MIALVGATSVASSEALAFKGGGRMGTGLIPNCRISHEIHPHSGIPLEGEKQKLAADAAPTCPGSS
jgi:hypothetical protein